MKKVALGLSGGVDSAVAAYLLKKEGYFVTGIFMKNWTGSDRFPCNWEKDREDAIKVAATLGIEFETWDFEKEYREKVVGYFFNEYKKGRTPNPDVMCNREIKFGLFYERAISSGYDFVATGHYARVEHGKEARLLKGIDPSKDQSYFLSGLTKSKLKKILLPIGEYKKSEIRKIADKIGLPNSKKPDSQGICFIGQVNIKDFLSSQIDFHKGNVIDTEGNIVGKHDGVEFYTVGQRHGLSIPNRLPYYVTDKDLKKNIVFVSLGDENENLYSNKAETGEIVWVDERERDGFVGEAVIRYHHKPVGVELKKNTTSNRYSVKFDVAQRAVTVGQAIVLYFGDELVGGGFIEN